MPIEAESVDIGDVVQVGLVPSLPSLPSSSEAYTEADFQVPSGKYELHQVPPHRMAEIVRQVVVAEGPIHRNEVVIRIRSLWRLQRAGTRIQAAVDAGVTVALSQHTVSLQDKDFLDVPKRKPKVRDRSTASSLTLRRPDYLPPSEVCLAIMTLVKDNLGATMEEVIQTVARQFGYKSTSAQLRVVIEDRVKDLVKDGHLNSDCGALTLGPAASEGL